MSSILNPRLGFGAAPEVQPKRLDERLAGKIKRAGTEAARRKFTPEFVNRLDKVVVFKPLGKAELRKILDIELGFVQKRIFASGRASRSFVFEISGPAKDFLLEEGTDMKYGARHLKRAVERHLVQPLSNLLATDQIRSGDLVRVDREDGLAPLTFFKQAEGLDFRHMAEMADTGSTRIRAIPARAREHRERMPAAEGGKF
jgi:ATP-dependent Clp protease ATP-binding subunit ClpA